MIKRKTQVIMAFFLASVLFSGCHVYSYEELGSRNIEPHHNVTTVPIIADIELLSKDKIVYTEKFQDVGSPNSFIDGLFRKKLASVDIIDAYKYTAMAHALKQYNADFLIGAVYDVDYSSKSDCLTITITGFPANYKELRKATPEDEWMLNMDK